MYLYSISQSANSLIVFYSKYRLPITFCLYQTAAVLRVLCISIKNLSVPLCRRVSVVQLYSVFLTTIFIICPTASGSLCSLYWYYRKALCTTVSPCLCGSMYSAFLTTHDVFSRFTIIMLNIHIYRLCKL